MIRSESAGRMNRRATLRRYPSRGGLQVDVLDRFVTSQQQEAWPACGHAGTVFGGGFPRLPGQGGGGIGDAES